MDFGSVIHSVSLTNPSWDLFVILAFVAGIGFYLLRRGGERAFWILLSTYISYAIITRLVLIERFLGWKMQNATTDKVMIFLIMILVVFFIVSKSVFVPAFRQGSRKAWFRTFIMSFLQIGLIVSLIVSFLTPQEVKNLSIFLRYFFGQDGAQLFWFLSPLAAIFLLKEK